MIATWVRAGTVTGTTGGQRATMPGGAYRSTGIATKSSESPWIAKAIYFGAAEGKSAIANHSGRDDGVCSFAAVRFTSDVFFPMRPVASAIMAAITGRRRSVVRASILPVRSR